MLSFENQKLKAFEFRKESDRVTSQKFCTASLHASNLQIHFQKSLTLQANSAPMRLKDKLPKKIIAFRSYSNSISINLNQLSSSFKLLRKIRNISRLIISLKYFDITAFSQVLKLLAAICPKRLIGLEFEFCSVEIRDYFMSLFRNIFLRRLKHLQALSLSLKAQSIEQFASKRWDHEIMHFRFLKRFAFETDGCACGDQEFKNVLRNLTRMNCGIKNLAVGLSLLAGASQNTVLNQLTDIFSKTECIQSIEIDFSSWNHTSFAESESFWKLLLGIKSLRKIDLTMNGVSISNHLLLALVRALKARSDIRGLKLRFLYSDINDLHVTNLASIWKTNKELETLHLEIQSELITGVGSEFLMGSLSQLSCIKDLSFSLKSPNYMKTSESTLIQLKSSAIVTCFSMGIFTSTQILNSITQNGNQFAKLNQIKLQLVRFVAHEFIELFSLLSTFPNLQEVDITYYFSELPQNFEPFELSFYSLKSVKVDLQKNAIGEDFFINLLQQLLRIETLSKLTIQARILKSKEVQSNSQIKLQHNFSNVPNLCELQLSFENSEFSDGGLDFVLTSFGSLHNLIEFELSLFGMSSDSEMWSQLPQLASLLPCLQKASFLLWLGPKNAVRLAKELLIWWRVWIVYNIELFTFNTEPLLDKLDSRFNQICKIFYIKNK